MSLRQPWLLVAALNGLCAVAAGAYGWHGLAADDGARQVFMMGVQYQMWHALGLLGIAWLAEGRSRLTLRLINWAGVLLTVGIVLFSGSLYWFGVYGVVPVNGLAPAGGFALMAGWALLAASALVRD